MGVLDKPLTPCVGICSTTSQGDKICIGCGRTDFEVRQWHTFYDADKKNIMARLEREKKNEHR